MVWVGKAEPPQYFLDNLNKWKDLMPHWTYMVWTNDKLTEEYFDKDYLELMKTITNPSQVSDFIRFYVMNKWGGYYLDADVTPLRNLEELPVQHPIVLCNDLPETGPNYMMCAFMAGVPNHPLWELCIEECKKEDLSIKYGVGITPTGPAVLGRSVYMISMYNKSISKNIIKDYDTNNVSLKVLNIILSYTNFIKQNVWKNY
jgi:mannosyltransferase OCH1-like enzyme